MTQAGIAAVTSLEGPSIAQNREFGGVVYEDANGVFSYSNPQPGAVCSGGGSCEVNFDANNPEGTTYLATYHTHPNTSGAQEFSAQDINSDIDNNVFGFLGTPPKGRVLMFNPGLLVQFNTFGGGASPICVLQGPLLGGTSCK